MPIERKTKVAKDPNKHLVGDTAIDLLTGDLSNVNEVPGTLPDAWPAPKKDKYYKVTKFVDEIVRRPLDLTKNKEDWKDTGESLATFGGYGRPLYHRLAQVGKNYDPRRTDQIFDELLTSEELPKTPQKFFNICKAYEISLKEIKQAEEVVIDIKAQLPDGVSVEDYFNHGFYEHEGSYYSVGKAGPQMVCGFTIKVLFLVKSKRNPKRIVELKNKYGYRSILDLPTDAFTSLGAFKKAVESVGNYVFEGSETDLTRLKKKLFQEEKDTQEVNTLGWHERGKFYAFANGIFSGTQFTEIDEYGIVPAGKQNFFLPFMSSIYQGDEDYTAEKKFRHVAKPGVSFEMWSDLIWKVYGINGALGICFCMSALFRDIFFNHLNFFPMLFCFGERQSGKSTFAESFKHLMGIPQDSISLENPSTVIGVVRTLANYSNALVVLDEYKNSGDKKMLGLLKGIWDGFGRTTGIKSNDTQTQVIKPRSTVFTMGQDMPTIDNALFTRYILLEFRDKGRDYENYDKLKALEKGGLTSITLEILRHRAGLEKSFLKGFQDTKKFFKDVLEENIEDRMLNNMAVSLTPAIYMMDNNLLKFPFAGKADNVVYADVADVVEALGKKLGDDLTAKENLLVMAVKIIRRQQSQISNTTDARKFWDIFVALVRGGHIKEGVDYQFKGPDKLFIRLGNIHPVYMEKHRAITGVPGQDKQTITYYLKNDPAFFGIADLRFLIPGAYDGPTQKKTSPTSCFGFDFKALKIDLASDGTDLEEPTL